MKPEDLRIFDEKNEWNCKKCLFNINSYCQVTSPIIHSDSSIGEDGLWPKINDRERCGKFEPKILNKPEKIL